jgi:hypothetical protein
MKQIGLFLACVMVAAALFMIGSQQKASGKGAGEKMSPGMKMKPSEKMPLMKGIEVSAFNNYKKWPLVRKDIPSAAHFNTITDTYVNKAGLKAFNDNTMKLPVGTVIVKENYESNKGNKGKLLMLTGMEKMKAGYDSANGDWAYAKSDPKFMIDNKFDLSACKQCHARSADKDFTFRTKGK